MKRCFIYILIVATLLTLSACSAQEAKPHIAVTTMPIYTFTQALCQDTPLQVDLLVQENVSCLHDYTLTVRHMKLLEQADLIVISGGGLEDFLTDILSGRNNVIDASTGIEMHCAEDAAHQDHGHHHDLDPHFWLSVKHAKQMAQNIYDNLCLQYPQYSAQFEKNMADLAQQFDGLASYAQAQLSDLQHRQLITFHDGFSYMAEEFDLSILHAIEEESGSEASPKDLIEICNLVTDNHLPAVFTEKNGSDAAAKIICAETGCKLYSLDMAMSGRNYFEAMYANINTLKEALG